VQGYKTEKTDVAEDLKETVNFAGLGVDIDVEVAGSGWKTRDGLDVCSESVTVKELVVDLVAKKGIAYR